MLHFEFVLELFFIQLQLILKQYYFRLQLDDNLLLLDHHRSNFSLKMIYQILFALQLALTLLVVDPQIFILNLDFIEEFLNFLEVLRVVFLRIRISHFLQLFFEFLVDGLQVTDFWEVRDIVLGDVTRVELFLTHLVALSCVGNSSATRPRADIYGTGEAWRVHHSVNLLEMLQPILKTFALRILVRELFLVSFDPILSLLLHLLNLVNSRHLLL